MIVPPLPAENTQTPIPTNGLPSPTGQLILHRQIQARTVSPTNKLRFSAVSFGDITNTNIESYAIQQAIKTIVGPSRKSDGGVIPLNIPALFWRFLNNLYKTHTPLDVNPYKPCFLLIELDPSTNWEFTPGRLAVTAKSKAFPLEDANVHYVTANGVIGPTHPDYGKGVPEGCRVIYWSILMRKRASPSDSILRGFNFYVDFRQMVTVHGQDYEHRMPTIFDPNVPNSGGSEFP